LDGQINFSIMLIPQNKSAVDDTQPDNNIFTFNLKYKNITIY